MSGFDFHSTQGKGKRWDLRVTTLPETRPEPQVFTNYVKDDDGRERKVKEVHRSARNLCIDKHFEGPPGEERLVMAREELFTWNRGDVLHVYTFFEGPAGHEVQRADLIVPTDWAGPDGRPRFVYADSVPSMSDALESVRTDVGAGKCNEETYSNVAKVLKHHHEDHEFARDHVAEE